MQYSIDLGRLADAARLLSLATVRGEDDCWIFNGALDDNNYGQFKFDGRNEGAHRASFAIFVGEPNGYVMHTCDVRPCINPKHLILGDHDANMADCAIKERNRTPRPGNGYNKINDVASLEIARLATAGVNYTQLGRMFGVTPPTARYHHRKHAC